MGNIYSLGKNIIWLDCYETSQELSLECVDVHIGFDIFKMATVAMVTMKDKTIYFLSNCNKISQEWFLGCVDVHLGFDTFKKFLLNYEFQNVEYQVGNEFSLAEFV